MIKHLLLLFLITILNTNLYAEEASITNEKKINSGISEILKRGVIRVGIYSQDKPPFVMTKNDGTLYGLDIDIAKDIAREMGVKVEFDRSSKSYAEMVERVSSGQDFDIVICKLSCTMQRALKARFSAPYLQFYQALALNKKFIARNKIDSKYPITQLKNMNFKIGIRTATSYVEYARSIFPKAEIIEGKWEDLVEKMLKGEIDGVMRDEYTIYRMLRKDPDIALYINIYTMIDRKDPICIAAPFENSMLQYWLNLYVDNNFPNPLNSDYLIKNYPELWKKNKETK